MHTFSPAKMWIAGLDALQKPLLHLHTQANVELPWADIDFDFMNLNQAAHGDREFGYIQTRLGVAAQDRRRATCPNPAVRAAGRGLAARRRRLGGVPRRSSSPASATTCATSPSPRATRPRPSCASACRSTRGASTSSPTPSTPRSDADVDALVAEYVDAYDVAAELLPGGDRHQSLRDGAAIELGLRSFLEEGGFGAFTTIVRGPRRAEAAARPRRAAAHGRGLRLRRRGRLEDRDPRARRERHGRGPARRREPHGGLHLRPRPRATSGSSARTCSRSRRR